MAANKVTAVHGTLGVDPSYDLAPSWRLGGSFSSPAYLA